MSLRTKTWGRFRLLRAYPIDLAIVSIVAAVAFYVVTAAPSGSAIRLLVAGGLVFFLPGYALVSVLFPAKTRRMSRSDIGGTRWPTRGIDSIERAGLSFVLSLAIVPIGVFALSVTEWGLTTESVTAALALGTIALSQLGAVRRLRVPAGERYTIALLGPLRRLGSSNEGAMRTASTAVLWSAIVLMVGVLVVSLVAPGSAGGFTEIGLYTETDEGDLVAGEIPDEIEPGESVPITFSVENQEGEDMEYTLVVQQQRVEDGTVTDRTELRTLDASITDGNTGSAERNVTPTAEDGETVRISVLLYHDEVPEQPTVENADDDTHFWISVVDESAEADNETVDNETPGEEFEDVEREGNETDTEDEDDGPGIDFDDLFGTILVDRSS